MIRTVLFDLDGTVLNSKEGVFQSASYALSALSMPMPDDDSMLAFLGPPLSQGFHHVCHVPEQQIDQAITLYREYYNSKGKFQASIYEGVAECIHDLKEKGLHCYITTSKPQVFAKQILEHFHLADSFDGIYGSELDGSRDSKADVIRYCFDQEGVDVSSVVLVGDRKYDVEGAKLLSIPCIGVLWGYGSEEELQKAGALKLINKPNELLFRIEEI